MTVPLFETLLRDQAIETLLGDAALARSMITVEAALARVQGGLGVIPPAAAAAIDQACADFTPDLAGLRQGMAEAAVPVPALVKQLRARVAGDAADHVHWGATSQDIVDTALILQLRLVMEELTVRLDRLIAALATFAEHERATLTIARTRGQQALPTSLGLKAAAWLTPLVRHRRRLAGLLPRVLMLQLGGAAGTLAAFGPRGLEVARALADELGLDLPPMPWHGQRDGLVELSGWLALITMSLGKLGQDVLLLAQNEVGELREAAGGGSSTMPHKANPIRAEALITLARRNATAQAGMLQAGLAAFERDGAAWQLEWATLPGMATATGAALALAEQLMSGLVVERPRIAANLAATRGLLLAEAASFALAPRLGRAKAEAAVRAACQALAAQPDAKLADILADRLGPLLDWAALCEPASYLGAADAMLDQVLSEAQAVLAGESASW